MDEAQEQMIRVVEELAPIVNPIVPVPATIWKKRLRREIKDRPALAAQALNRLKFVLGEETRA